MTLIPPALAALIQKAGPAAVAQAADQANRSRITILDLMNRFESTFSPPEDWKAWRAFLSALFGLPMGTDLLPIYQSCTKRTLAPLKPFREAHLIIGRRGGKSFASALVAVFLAIFRDYSKYLKAGEQGTVMVMAADREQAHAVFGYIVGFIESDIGLASLVESKTKEHIKLKNGITIAVHTASYRAVRGYTVVAAICDEIAFWRSEDSANPDTEILNAIRPGMTTIPGSMLLCLSSPYARRGALWDAYDKHYGIENAPVLVWKASTLTMHNSAEVREAVNKAYDQDEVAAAAEFGAEFRTDVESFVSREAVEAAIMKDVKEIPYEKGRHYFAFCDPSGGSVDSMTLGIAHAKAGRVILDYLDEVRAPFEPEREAVSKFAPVLKRYGLNAVHGDKYAGGWPAEQFRKHGIAYIPSEESKSDIYGFVLPLLNNRSVDLLDIPRLKAQLLGLERKTSRAGKDSIDHAKGAQDDLINAAAGALRQAALIGLHIPEPVVQRKLTPLETRQLEYQEAVQRMLNGDESEIPERYRYMGQ